MADHDSSLFRRARGYLFTCFLLSGCTGLVYEVVWTRMLALTFGHTAYAMSTVIGAFMAGLALGSLWGGGLVDRVAASAQSRIPALLRWYAGLELGVGVYVLCTPFLLAWVEKAYLAAVGDGSATPAATALCFGLSFAVLVVPTFCMGATLPVVTRALVRTLPEAGRELSRAYGLNTLGGMLGAGLAGLYLIPAVGLTLTLQTGAMLNLAIGALMVFWAGHLSRQDRPEAVGMPAPGADALPVTGSGRVVGPIVAAVGLAGFASMVYEVAWTRAITLGIGSSTYAFSLILIGFLFGIGLGSLLYGKLLGGAGRPRTVAALAWILGGIGLSGILLLPLLGALPYLYYKIFPFVGSSYGLVLAADGMICILLLLVPTTLMGLALPLAMDLAADSVGTVGARIGTVYAANTAGGIAGAVLAGFVLMAVFGAQASVKIGVALNLAAGIVLFCWAPRPRAAVSAAALVLLGVIGLWIVPRWDPAVMTSGAGVYVKAWSRSSWDVVRAAQISDPIFYRDGANATVTVNMQHGLIFLRVNGKTDASTGGPDMDTQTLLGSLGGLYHPHPRRVCVIGLGSGITVDLARLFPGVESVECAEIEPAVVEANRFFAEVNHRVLADPRVRLVVADGRTHLLAAKRPYDLIVSEPSNPWIAGIANLYTREFYRACAGRLAPGGVMVQWMHMYNLSPEDLKMVLRTFFDAFPEGAVWRAGYDVFLVGQLQPGMLDLPRMRRLLAPGTVLAARLAVIGVTRPTDIFAFYLARRQDFLPLLAVGPVNTDDLPLLEFSAPWNLYLDTQEANLAGLLRYQHGLWPDLSAADHAAADSVEVHVALARLNLARGQLQAAQAEADRALELDARNPVALFLRARIAEALQRPEAARLDLERALSEARATPRQDQGLPLALKIELSLGDLYLAQGLTDQAAIHFNETARRFPRSPLPRLRQAALERRLGHPKSVLARMRQAAALDPKERDIRAALGAALLNAGQFPEAVAVLEAIVREDPDNLQAESGLAAAYLDQGLADKAAAVYARLVQHQPGSVDVRIGYGSALRGMGRWAEALAQYSAALDLDPFDPRLSSLIRAAADLQSGAAPAASAP